VTGHILRRAALFAAGAFYLTIGTAAAQGPAVSAPNGKLEFDAGALSLPAPAFMARAAGTLTLPIGERFGLQADFSATTAPGFTTSAAFHLFTRDPEAYLIGGALGIVRSPGAMVVAAGPEAELYLDRWTLEAWAGASMVRPTAPAGPDRYGVFALAGVGYYPTDNWRLSLGLSTLDGYNAVAIGTEYLLDNFNMPIALTGEARIGQDGAVRALFGLRGYLGPDPHKSLIDRHRQDDPTDLSTALLAATNPQTLSGTPKTESKPATSSEPPPSSSQAPLSSSEQPASSSEPPGSSSQPASSSSEPPNPPPDWSSSASEEPPPASSSEPGSSSASSSEQSTSSSEVTSSSEQSASSQQSSSSSEASSSSTSSSQQSASSEDSSSSSSQESSASSQSSSEQSASSSEESTSSSQASTSSGQPSDSSDLTDPNGAWCRDGGNRWDASTQACTDPNGLPVTSSNLDSSSSSSSEEPRPSWCTEGYEWSFGVCVDPLSGELIPDPDA
jgi:hypothetical protein